MPRVCLGHQGTDSIVLWVILLFCHTLRLPVTHCPHIGWDVKHKERIAHHFVSQELTGTPLRPLRYSLFDYSGILHSPDQHGHCQALPGVVVIEILWFQAH